MIFVVPYMDNKNAASLSLGELYLWALWFSRKETKLVHVYYYAGCFSVTVAAEI